MNDTLSPQPLHQNPQIIPPSSEESTTRIIRGAPTSPSNQFLRPQRTAHLIASHDEYDGHSLSEQPLLSTPTPSLQPDEPRRLSVSRDEWKGRAPVDEYFSVSIVSPDDLSDREQLQPQGAKVSPNENASFRPTLPPLGYHPLNFRPSLLRPKWTILLMLVYFAISGGIAALLYTSGDDHKFLVDSENVQLVARYCPGLTATITNLLFRQTNRDTMRMKPYFAMADQKNTITKGTTPRKSIASAYFPWVGLGITPFSWLYLFLWISNIVASSLVAFKTVLLGTTQTGSNWVLTVRSGPAHYLMGGYILMGLVNLVILVYTWSRSTGLQWDPVSIGDFIALFARCNALQCFKDLEHDSDGHSSWSAGNRRAWKRMSENLRFRIGYWESTTPTLNGTPRTETVYGIGVLNGPTASITAGDTQAFQDTHLQPTIDVLDSRSSTEQDTSIEAIPPVSESLGRLRRPRMSTPTQRQPSKYTDWYDNQASRLCSCKSYPACEHYPYYSSVGLGTFPLVFWFLIIITAMAACVYAVISGAINGGFSVANTWGYSSFNSSIGIGSNLPEDYNDPSSVYNYALVFRALPTQVAGFFCITYFPVIDTNMRFMQPYKGMFDSPGSAAHSISLAYLTASSLKVPLDALDNGHYKVAWFAIMNTISPLLPIVVASLLTIESTDGRVNFIISKSAFSIIFVYLVAYAVSLPLAWPVRYRRLPRYTFSVADLMGQCHQARFIADPIFDISPPRSSKEKMDAWILLRENKYLFGWYLGRDEKSHLGFDAVATENDGVTGLVRFVPPSAKWVRAVDKKPSWIARLFSGKTTKKKEDLGDYEMTHQQARSGLYHRTQDEQEHENFMSGAMSTAVEV